MKYLVQIIFYTVILGALVVINLNQLTLSLAEYQDSSNDHPISAPVTAPSEPESNSDNNGPSVCGDQLPGVPVLQSVTKTGPNQVTVKWSKPAGPVSGYVLAYGLTPAKMLYGNSNIGNVNSFVVNHLQAKTAYYFQVDAVNGCTPGAFSNTLGVSAYGKIITNKVASGFSPATQGAVKAKSVAKTVATPSSVPVPSITAKVTPTPVQPVTQNSGVSLTQLVSNVFGKILSFLYR